MTCLGSKLVRLLPPCHGRGCPVPGVLVGLQRVFELCQLVLELLHGEFLLIEFRVLLLHHLFVVMFLCDQFLGMGVGSAVLLMGKS